MIVSGWSPLAISLWVSLWASLAALISGFALAWMLVKTHMPGKWFLEGATLLTLVLPPTVVGYYLLLVFGQQGLGPLLQSWFGLRIVFAWPGAVLASSIAALPLVVQTVRVSLAGVSSEVEDAARVDGANRWQMLSRIELPLAWRGIAAGALLGFLRAMGEFGATLMVAGSIPGRTQTLAMAVYEAVQVNDIPRANSYAILLSLIALIALMVVLRLNRRFEQRE
jgi:molybdate transport system permease protein